MYKTKHSLNYALRKVCLSLYVFSRNSKTINDFDHMSSLKKSSKSEQIVEKNCQKLIYDLK
jgi:hypothetical protein